jgi:hypothetical protein
MIIRRSLPLLGTLILVGVVMQASQASIINSVKQQIQSAYDQADAAASRKDTNAAVAHYADPGMAQVTKAGLSRLLAITQQQVFSTKIGSITMSKNDIFSATVVVRQHFQGLSQKNKGKIELLAYDAKIREYWIKRGPSWLVLRSRTLAFQRTLNSKPVNNW